MLTIPEKKSVLFLTDLAVTVATGLLALLLTALLSPFRGEELVPQAASIVVLGILLLLVGYLNDTLDIESLRRNGTYLKRWAQAWAVGMGLFAAGYFFLGAPWGQEAAVGMKLTRFAPLIFAALLFFLVPLGRMVAGKIGGLQHVHRVCVVAGAGQSAREFVALSNTGGAWRVACLVDDDPQKAGLRIEGSEVSGKLHDLPQIAERYRASDIILAINSPLGKKSLDGVMKCFEEGLEILTVAQAVERTCGRIPIRSLGDKWLPGTFWSATDRPLIQRVVKRGTDLAFSLLLLVLFLPVTLLVVLFSPLFQGFPLLYRQQRVGRSGRIFTLLKFRTMKNGSEKHGAIWAGENDARTTAFGRWLRRTRLDELPQLWNILRGEMSLVGPRPERPEFVGLLESEIPFYRARLAIKPGLTGWAQIKFGYAGDVNDAKTKLEYDLYYIKNRSIWLDVLILLQTARVVLGHRGR